MHISYVQRAGFSELLIEWNTTLYVAKGTDCILF